MALPQDSILHMRSFASVTSNYVPLLANLHSMVPGSHWKNLWILHLAFMVIQHLIPAFFLDSFFTNQLPIIYALANLSYFIPTSTPTPDRYLSLVNIVSPTQNNPPPHPCLQKLCPSSKKDPDLAPQPDAITSWSEFQQGLLGLSNCMLYLP